MSNDFDKHQVLDTVNQWIFNCDTKASIILATISAFLTIVLSSDIGHFMAETLKDCINNITVCKVMYLLIWIVGLILLIIGMYKLVSVLVPKINLNHTSVMFFGNVASYSTFDDYCDAINKCVPDQVSSDLLHQIYAASTICSQKFKNHKSGIILSFIGIAIWLFWLLVGFWVYYI